MNSKYYIIMADIIGSGKTKDVMTLAKSFAGLVKKVNASNKDILLSPLTITLGDEFQGIATSLTGSIELLISLEEQIISLNKSFKLRYVVYYGAIDTKINTKLAYGMLGEGLTQARQLLESLKNEKRKRFHLRVDSNQKLSRLLNLTFQLYQSTIDGWKTQDFKLINGFINQLDFKEIATSVDRDLSSIYRRKDTLRIDDYFSSREALRLLVSEDSIHIQSEAKIVETKQEVAKSEHEIIPEPALELLQE